MLPPYAEGTGSQASLIESYCGLGRLEEREEEITAGKEVGRYTGMRK